MYEEKKKKPFPNVLDVELIIGIFLQSLSDLSTVFFFFFGFVYGICARKTIYFRIIEFKSNQMEIISKKIWRLSRSCVYNKREREIERFFFFVL